MDWDALVWESGLAGSGLCCHYPSEKLDPLPYIGPVPVGI